MVVNVISVLVLVGLAVFFGWLARRAWRARRAWLKWPGLVLSGLFTLLFTAVTVIVLVGFVKLNIAPAAYLVSPVKIAMTADQVARGQQLSHICNDCHSTSGQYPLDGSKDNFLAGGPPLGTLYAPNLTPGGPLKDWSDGEVLRALREGIDKDGRPLMIMPSMAMHSLSDADAQAMVAFLRSQPAVEHVTPARDLNVLAAAFLGIGMIPTSAQEPITQPVVAPPAGTPEYGLYLIRAMGCSDCHGQKLTGGGGGFAPAGPNLTLIVPKWSQADFLNLFRKGLDPTGRVIGEGMPWKNYNPSLTDSELGDIYSYIHGLPPVTSTSP
jgi:mono/diheme cytochrome c family protein